jgi:microcystin-dependent protein
MGLYENKNNQLNLLAGGTLYADAPVGSIQAYGGATAPFGWLLCQGQAISRATYAELFGVIGTSFGVGDGSTTFNVPDLRESVPVGSGTRGSGVSAHDTYAVGQFKDDQMQNAEGHFTAYSYSDGLAGGAFSSNIDNPDVLMGGTTPTLNFDDFSFNLSNVARTGTTTHGKQLGVNFIIKATTIALPSDFEDAFKRESIVVAGTGSNGVLFERSNNVVCVQLNGIDAPTLIAAAIPEKFRPKRQVLTTGTLVHTGLSYGYVCYIWFYPSGAISGAYNKIEAKGESFSTQSDWAIFGSTSWII